jgi:hypothetical protein
MAQGLRSYVARDGWDADGIKLDFCYTSAPLWSRYADPSWGAGEQYRARVLRFVYQTIKAAKRDALVTGGTANPLFGRVEDVCRLNEDWFGDDQAFGRRAATVTALGMAAECDDWLAYEHYLPTQAVERPVWGTFTLMSALYRGDRGNVARPLSPEWAARLSSITALAAEAPVRQGQRWRHDAESGALLRETAEGALVAAALPLEGARERRQVLAVAQPGGLRLCAIADGRVVLPVRERVRQVTEVWRDGTRHVVPTAARPGGVEVAVRDSAGEVAWYEVRLASVGATLLSGPR